MAVSPTSDRSEGAAGCMGRGAACRRRGRGGIAAPRLSGRVIRRTERASRGPGCIPHTSDREGRRERLRDEKEQPR